MNKQYTQLESRLDEILSRIAKETEEIKDLEQQLTDGEIEVWFKWMVLVLAEVTQTDNLRLGWIQSGY